MLTASTSRHEIAGHAIDQSLHRRPAALRLADHADDLRQQRVAADPLGPHHQAAGAVDRAADDLGSRLFLDRDRLAGDHRLIDGAAALDDDAIDRHLFAGPDAQQIAGLHVGPAARPLHAPSGRTTRAVFGARPSSFWMADGVWPRARSSSTCPSSTSTVTTAAVSK